MKRAYFLYLLFVFNVTHPEFCFVSNKTGDGYLKQSFIKEIVETFQSDIFIETGTYSGETTANAAPFFKEVHTIELSTVLYEKAQEKLNVLTNVRVYQGHSSELFGSIIPHCKGTILFWLDAHYSGGNTALSNSNPDNADAITAIRQELKAIAQSGLTDCVLLIDDMRGFGSTINDVEFLGCWAYPSIQEVCALGRQINKNFECVLLGDSLLMYDKTKYTPSFSPVVRACTLSRLYDGTNFSEDQLLEAERVIMFQATQQERNFITELYTMMTPWKDPLFHHDLWYVCISMGLNEWKEAEVALAKVPERVEYFDKNRKTVNNIKHYNPSRFTMYFEKINNNIL